MYSRGTRPPLIFLDEPTTGLDPRTRGQMWDTIRGLVNEGCTVLLTTQYLDEADQLAGRIAVIDRGRKVAEGTPDELKASVGNSTLQVQLAPGADQELARRGGLDALDDAVVRPRDRGQAGSDDVHRLVVVGRNLEELPARQDRGDDRAAGDADLVGAEAVDRAGVGVVPHELGHVLVEGAAAGDVEHLRAPADAKQRNALADAGLGDGQFPGVPVTRGDFGLRVLGGAVDGGIDVATSGNHKAVKDGHGRFGLRLVAARREQNRTAPAVPDGRDVGERQQGTLLRPATPVGVGVVRGDANGRRHLSPSVIEAHRITFRPPNCGRGEDNLRTLGVPLAPRRRLPVPPRGLLVNWGRRARCQN